MGDFEPNGSESKWQIIYDLVKDKDVGYFLSMNQLCELTGLGKGTFQSLITTHVNKHLLEDYNKKLKNVRGRGYKVASPEEQVNDGIHVRRKKIRVQSKLSLRELKHVPMDELTEAQKNSINHVIDRMEEVFKKMHLSNMMSQKKQKEALAYMEKHEMETIELHKILREGFGKVDKQVNKMKEDILKKFGIRKEGEEITH